MVPIVTAYSSTLTTAKGQTTIKLVMLVDITLIRRAALETKLRTDILKTVTRTKKHPNKNRNIKTLKKYHFIILSPLTSELKPNVDITHMSVCPRLKKTPKRRAMGVTVDMDRKLSKRLDYFRRTLESSSL